MTEKACTGPSASVGLDTKNEDDESRPRAEGAGGLVPPMPPSAPKAVAVRAWLIVDAEGLTAGAILPDLGSLAPDEREEIGWALRSLADDLIGPGPEYP